MNMNDKEIKHQIEDIMEGKAGVDNITTFLADNPESVRDVSNKMKNDPAMSRFVMRAKNDPSMISKISGTSYQDQRKIRKTYENAGNTRQTNGMKAVQITTTRKYKQCFYPHELAEYVERQIDDTHFLLHKEQNARMNSVVKNLLGQELMGDIIIFKREGGKIRDLTVEEVKSIKV